MAAGKNNRKKNRISKHVLKAKEDRDGATTPAGAEDLPIPTPLQPPKKQVVAKKAKAIKIKDPSEAASYLSAWKHRAAGGAWKFNKNTQSWLIRHMYEVDKVAKPSFVTLMEYLQGLKGKDRVIEDAERRAVRYKEFEKTLDAKTDGGKEKEAKSEEAKGEKTKEDSAETPVKDDGGEDDEARWQKLDEHDKRKEYKRARKILETLQA
mmetsp:Transcript_1833/g.2850  ORF Transcript_1833/g.2850 Transcript_1833/m.2850 type:complete len:208 (-) Transcript_1833:333-956(-)